MSKSDFFDEIEHTRVAWGEYQLHVPVFYPDIMFLSATILAPAANIKAILPSQRLKPYRITPWHAALSISAYQYRETDLGPYNEVAISVPVTLDTESPLFTGSLRRTPEPILLYSHHLPVSTEIARVVGAEFAGYPKFVAQIEFEEDDRWVSCSLKAEEKEVLLVRGRKLDLAWTARRRVHPLTYRRGFILRSEFVINERQTGASRNEPDLQLQLGDHPIADELREMRLGRMLGVQFCPHAQGILTPVIESFAI
jgi:hypothetical protein